MSQHRTPAAAAAQCRSVLAMIVAGLLGTSAVGRAATVGYYEMCDGQGRLSQAAPITAAGHVAVRLFDMRAADLAGIDVAFVDNCSGTAYGTEYLSRQTDIATAVNNGMVLMIHDRFVTPAETILPGASTFDIVRDVVNDTANIDVLDTTTLLTSGPGGVVNNATLDGGTFSSHGYATAASLPSTVRKLLSRTNPAQVVTLSYRVGAGGVVYSTIPLDFYLDGGGQPNFASIYAPNAVAYAARLQCGDGVVSGSEQCDDGNTVGGDCCSATCQFEAAGASCTSDGNVCTTDVCSANGTCLHSANTLPCNDGVFCNGTDTCLSGACAVHAGNPCPGADGDLNCAESCDESADSCTAPDPNGSACADDTNPCTVDTCGGGVCLHTPIPACSTTTTTSTSTSTSSTTSTSTSSSSTTSTSSSSTTSTSTSSSVTSSTSSTTTTSTSTSTSSTSTSTSSSTTTSSTSTSTTTLPPPCAPAPRGDCGLPVVSGKSKVLLKDATPHAKDALSWLWGAGDATTLSDFGDPMTTQAYAFCIYAGGAPVLSAPVPPGGQCGTTACWKANGKGFKYANKLGTASGITKITLKIGTAGAAKITVRGKGEHLLLPVLGGLPLPVHVQMQATKCWGAQFGAAAVNDTGRFKAPSD